MVLALSFASEGDVLAVTRLDSLTRSVGDLHRIIESLTEKGVAFRCLNQPGVDTDTSTGRLMLAVLWVACFESDIRRDAKWRRKKAMLAGKYRGRPPSIDPTKVKELRSTGMGAAAIATTMGIGRASVSAALAA
ncbi:MAG: hypothetical protein JWN59_157 [Sphingomonas bacterium]|nr:hypothetical protein [Sphingomonas bacterium]